MAEQTRYVVQRRFEFDGAEPVRGPEALWEDVGFFEARSTVEAIEAAVGTGKNAKPGTYRTSAARYLSDPVPVEITTEVVVKVGATAAEPARPKEPAAAS